MLYKQFTKSKTFSIIILAIGLIAFLFIKIPSLSIPYFWDESWVYGPAVSEMGNRLPSLLPGAIDIDLSRGHPMLFHFLGGIWGNIFGISVTSLHLFSLAISLLFVFFYFRFLSEYLGKHIHYALVFLLFQGIFLAQSAMVLPEILVALFVLLSLHAFSKDKINLSILYASLCLLSKESGAVLFPALGLSYLFHHLLTNTFSWKNSFLFLAKLVLGVLPFLAFLIIQKMRFGWYFFPNHLDLQIDTVTKFQAQFISALHYVFYAQGRILLTAAAIVSYFYHFRKNRLACALLGVSLIHVIICLSFPFSTWLILIIYLLLSILSLIPFAKAIQKAYTPSLKPYLSITVFTGIYLIFTALNFYSSRYILCLIPLSIFISFKALSTIKKEAFINLFCILNIGLCLILALKNSPVSDVNQSFVEVGQAQKALFEYLEEEELYGETFMAPFLVHESLKKIYAGHRSNETPFTSVPYYPSPDNGFYNIISSFEGEYINADHKKGRTKEIIKIFKSGDTSFTLEKYSAVNK